MLPERIHDRTIKQSVGLLVRMVEKLPVNVAVSVLPERMNNRTIEQSVDVLVCMVEGLFASGGRVCAVREHPYTHH